MSVFVKTLSDIVALFLQALRLSVVIPSFILVGLNIAFIVPLFEQTRVYELLQEHKPLFPVAVVVLFFVLLGAYVLAVLNVPIIRFFEGYPLLPLRIGKRLRISNYRRVRYLQEQIQQLDEEVTQSDQASQDAPARIRECELMRNIFNHELCWMYPHHQTWRVLPTRLGNAIAAAEEYPGHLYGIDAVTFWHFLAPLLEKSGYASYVEKEKALLDFLLNMAVVTLVFGAELVYVDILRYQLLWALPWDKLLTWLSALAKLGTAVVLAFCFYLMAIRGAVSWGYTIRTAFVLHKESLRQKLGLAQAEGFYEERILWRLASRFYRDHDVTPGRYIFKFDSISDPPSKQDQSKGGK